MRTTIVGSVANSTRLSYSHRARGMSCRLARSRKDQPRSSPWPRSSAFGWQALTLESIDGAEGDTLVDLDPVASLWAKRSREYGTAHARIESSEFAPPYPVYQGRPPRKHTTHGACEAGERFCLEMRAKPRRGRDPDGPTRSRTLRLVDAQVERTGELVGGMVGSHPPVQSIRSPPVGCTQRSGGEFSRSRVGSVVFFDPRLTPTASSESRVVTTYLLWQPRGEHGVPVRYESVGDQFSLRANVLEGPQEIKNRCRKLEHTQRQGRGRTDWRESPARRESSPTQLMFLIVPYIRNISREWVDVPVTT